MTNNVPNATISNNRNVVARLHISMIENGKRLPSEDVLTIIANVFQKEESWFLDENLEVTIQSDDEKPIKNIPLEPGFLYSLQDNPDWFP